MWSHKYDRTADFIVIEGPKAGGHLGFSNEQLNNTASLDFDNEITNIIECKKEYEDKYSKKYLLLLQVEYSINRILFMQLTLELMECR